MAPADVLIGGLQLFQPDGAGKTPTAGFDEVVRSGDYVVRLQKKDRRTTKYTLTSSI